MKIERAFFWISGVAVFLLCALVFLFGVLELYFTSAVQREGKLLSNSPNLGSILNLILVEEKEKLGMSSYDISIEPNWKVKTCQIKKIKADKGFRYEIRANPNWAGRLCVRHELYHAYKDHFFGIWSSNTAIRYLAVLFINEPTANPYALFG